MDQSQQFTQREVAKQRLGLQKQLSFHPELQNDQSKYSNIIKNSPACDNFLAINYAG
jgi:hypothetical protein